MNRSALALAATLLIAGSTIFGCQSNSPKDSDLLKLPEGVTWNLVEFRDLEGGVSSIAGLPPAEKEGLKPFTFTATGTKILIVDGCNVQRCNALYPPPPTFWESLTKDSSNDSVQITDCEIVLKDGVPESCIVPENPLRLEAEDTFLHNLLGTKQFSSNGRHLQLFGPGGAYLAFHRQGIPIDEKVSLPLPSSQNQSNSKVFTIKAGEEASLRAKVRVSAYAEDRFGVTRAAFVADNKISNFDLREVNAVASTYPGSCELVLEVKSLVLTAPTGRKMNVRAKAEILDAGGVNRLRGLPFMIGKDGFVAESEDLTCEPKTTTYPEVASDWPRKMVEVQAGTQATLKILEDIKVRVFY
ncbi:MAG: hypothetical protein KDD70_05945 [Bdellovibrionales bacterium]|nr:hypothetical protein [Bdellovibrionales bacterium]